MKNSKIFKLMLVGMILLTSIQTYAFNNCSETDLVTAMSVDEDVKSLFDISARVSIALTMSAGEVPDEVKGAIKDANEKIATLNNKIDKKFPEYAKKSELERRETLREISETPQMRLTLKNFLNCIKDDLYVFATCASIGTRWKTVGFIGCVSFSVIGDLIIFVGTGGADGPFLTEELIAELRVCVAIFSDADLVTISQCAQVGLAALFLEIVTGVACV
ncbi:hypothetical protein ACFO3O_05850 [Dokdonia ponticola]|uniref:Uncharacterized protein n=1 Tax=Dokdonia ponticola TaxID=2041041 RepID=A0ABV9HTG1_9FLAO